MSSCHEICRQNDQSGSILILVLVVCLALALLVHVMSTVALCVDRAIVDETSGRQRLNEKDDALAECRLRALADWQPFAWQPLETQGLPAEGSLGVLEGTAWVMKASARQDPSVSITGAAAWVERGRDGLDLPLAAVVAGSVSVDADRLEPWLEADTACGPEVVATAFLHTLSGSTLIGEGCSVERHEQEWRLDPGWAAFALAQTSGESGGAEADGDAAGASAVLAGPNVIIAEGSDGRWLSLTDLLKEADKPLMGREANDPLLVVITGGAGLDASGAGGLCAVLVVDGGPVDLEDTVIRGAVFASGVLDVGATGRVVFCRQTLRWAADRSLARARLVPGTRWEGTE